MSQGYYSNDDKADPFGSSSSSSGFYPTPSPWTPPSPWSPSSGSNNNAQPPPPYEVVGVGVFVDIFLIIVAIVVIKYCRYAASASSSSCRCCSLSWWSELITKNPLYWKTNVYFLVNMFLIMVTIPCIVHIGSCFVANQVCTWGINLNTPNNATDPIFSFVIEKIGHLANNGDNAVGEVTILRNTIITVVSILFGEMIISFFLSLLSLRWYNEASLNPYNTKYPAHMLTVLPANEDMKHEWRCVSGLRVALFVFGVFVFTVGSVVRVVFYSWLLSYWFVGGGNSSESGIYFNSYSLPEMIIVVVWGTFHYFTFLFLCCKKTFTEHHMMHGDYAGYICPTCEAVGGLMSQKCQTCGGTGLKYETQNSHYSTPLI